MQGKPPSGQEVRPEQAGSRRGGEHRGRRVGPHVIARIWKLMGREGWGEGLYLNKESH